jgi:hypothetical protein
MVLLIPINPRNRISLFMRYFFLLRSVVISSIVLLLQMGCQEAPQRNCTKFKTGRFSFSTVVDNDTLTTVFVRNENIEVEYFQGRQDTSSVRWINDCEYILRKLNPRNRTEEKSVHIKILTTTDSSYTFEFSAVGESKKLRGTAIKTH